MLRPRSNWIVIEVEPSELDDVISSTPGICANCVSSGCATDDAIVSGLAPGSEADTWMVGKSICGSGATGSSGYEIRPTKSTPTINSEVAIGRWTKGAEIPPIILSHSLAGLMHRR